MRWFPAFLLGLIATSACAVPLGIPAKPLADLRSQEFRVREAAELELLAWGRLQPEPAMNELLRQSRIADDPEVRERCLNVLRELVTDEYLKEGDGYLGINMGGVAMIKNVPGDPKPCGVVLVNRVMPDSAAERAGLKRNDQIVELDGERWHDGGAAEAFTAKIRLKKPNSKVALKVLREDKLIDMEAVLGKLPASVKNGSFGNPEAAERAEKEAYFRRWLSQRKLPE